MEELGDGWKNAGNVVWKDFDSNGSRYSVAAGPRGRFLWTQGNAGTDLVTLVGFALWDRVTRTRARRVVVMVRRRGLARLRFQVLRREFLRP
jgi:hypothetical protein